MEIEQKIIEIIAGQLSARPSDITPQTHLIDDLGIDSLDSVELTMALEEEFAIEIPDEAVTKLSTVQQIIDYVKEKKNL
jgi:acyl carrier protein